MCFARCSRRNMGSRNDHRAPDALLTSTVFRIVNGQYCITTWPHGKQCCEHFVFLLLQVNPNSLGSSPVIVRVSLLLFLFFFCLATLLLLQVISTGIVSNFAILIPGRTRATRTTRTSRTTGLSNCRPCSIRY